MSKLIKLELQVTVPKKKTKQKNSKVAYMQGSYWCVYWLTSTAECICIQSVVVSVCQVEYLPNPIDDFTPVGLSKRLYASLILRSQSALRLQHSLSAAPGLGPEQRLHLAGIGTRALRSPGAPKEPEGWGSRETLRGTRLDWAQLSLTQHCDWGYFNTLTVLTVL